MDETPDKPKVFANRVVKQLVQHTVAEDMVITNDDYLAIRKVFRQCGGSWANLASGDQIQIELLKTIVSNWGKMPGRVKESDRIV
jgi:hypothetical protein